MPYRWIVPILALSTVTLLLTVPHGSSDSLVSATQRPTTASRGPIVGVFPMPDPDEQYAIQTAVDQYLADQYQQVTAYLDALEQTRLADEAARVAEEVAARRAATAGATGGRVQASAVMGVCGGATNGADRFIGRESGGNPGVYNSGGSGAWGCYQIMPGTWNGSCSDIGQYGSASPAQQAACASRLPLSAWGG